MNEAERFLVKNWEEASLLEESMKTVRRKYEELFERMKVAVIEAHPELIASKFWNSDSIGFGKESWPVSKYGSPSGFWLYNLQLEKLAAEDSDPPTATIQVFKSANLDFPSTIAVLKEAAQKTLSPEDMKDTVFGKSLDPLLTFKAPSKRELLDLLSEGDEDGFVNRLVSQFDFMARWIPVLDKVFEPHLMANKQAVSKA